MRITELYQSDTNRTVLIDHFKYVYLVRCFERGDYVKTMEFKNYQEAFDWSENWNLKYEE